VEERKQGGGNKSKGQQQKRRSQQKRYPRAEWLPEGDPGAIDEQVSSKQKSFYECDAKQRPGFQSGISLSSILA
jgi:hypothetical protein